MTDTRRFDDAISEFLLPMNKLGKDTPNETYFLTRDDLFVFAEGYCHPFGKIHGKIIYYPDPSGSYDYYGRRFASSFKKLVDGELCLLSHDIQLATQFRVRPSVKPTSQMPVHAEFRIEFDLSEFKGFFDHRRSLALMMKKHSIIGEAVRNLSIDFDLPIERIGATGSLSFGIFDELDDLDLVFYGLVEENRKLLSRIFEHTSAADANKVIEFGKLWPIRFFHNGVLICPFFCYTDRTECPVRDFMIEVLEEAVTFEGTVGDDTHSIYFPVFLGMEDVHIDGEKCADIPLVNYDSSLRGEYYRGDRLAIKGRKVRIHGQEGEFKAILATLSSQISKF